MADTFKRPWALAIIGGLIVGAMGLVSAKWTVTSLHDGNIPTAICACLGAVSMASIVGLMLTIVLRPTPRVAYTARGLEVRAARIVRSLVVTMSVSFVAAMALFAVLYATGHLDFHASDRSDRRFVDRMFGLALAMPFIIGIPYLPAIRAWFRGERRAGQRNPPVLVSPAGVQIARLGAVGVAPWDQITDVRTESPGRNKNLLVLDVRDSPPIYTEAVVQLGGTWLVDTIRMYWQHPQERWRLTAGT